MRGASSPATRLFSAMSIALEEFQLPRAARQKLSAVCSGGHFSHSVSTAPRPRSLASEQLGHGGHDDGVLHARRGVLQVERSRRNEQVWKWGSFWNEGWFHDNLWAPRTPMTPAPTPGGWLDECENCRQSKVAHRERSLLPVLYTVSAPLYVQY